MRTPIVLALLLAGAAAPVAAQEVPRKLTLDDAIRIALQRNPAHRRVLNDEDVTAVGERAAWSQFLPNVSANLSTGVSKSRFVSGADDDRKSTRLNSSHVKNSHAVCCFNKKNR